MVSSSQWAEGVRRSLQPEGATREGLELRGIVVLSGSKQSSAALGVREIGKKWVCGVGTSREKPGSWNWVFILKRGLRVEGF